MKQGNLFDLLRTKEIIAVLDGDTSLGKTTTDEGEDKNLSMPYLSGKAICDLAVLFGFPMSYNAQFGPSRRDYMDELFQHAIKGNCMSDLLVYLFSKERFSSVIQAQNADEVDRIYTVTVNAAIDRINGYLSFGGNEIVKAGSQFIIHPVGTKVAIETPTMKTIIDRDYIKDMSARALMDVDQGNLDSAITKSRTLLEEVFCYVVEKKGQQPLTNGDIGALFKQVKGLYNMHSDPNTDRRILTLISGLNGIVNGIAEMRNKDSDAHGVGASRIQIMDYHARLFVNASMTMSEFILSVANNANK